MIIDIVVFAIRWHQVLTLVFGGVYIAIGGWRQLGASVALVEAAQRLSPQDPKRVEMAKEIDAAQNAAIRRVRLGILVVLAGSAAMAVF